MRLCECVDTSPSIDIIQKGPTTYNVSSERHRQSGVNEIAQVRHNANGIRTKIFRLSVRCSTELLHLSVFAGLIINRVPQSCKVLLRIMLRRRYLGPFDLMRGDAKS